MLQNISKFDDALSQGLAPQQRLKASARASFKFDGQRTRIDNLYQHASAKIRFPKTYDAALEAVLINTAGGLTGGDELAWKLELGEGAHVTTSTQANEKAYASSFGVANVATNIELSANARLNWLPQETILYNQSSLSRTFDIQLHESAELLAVESLVMGREAMGEKPEGIFFKDRWRIKRGEKLIFADDLRLDESCKTNAQMGDYRAVSTLVFITNQDDESLSALAQKLNQISNANLSAFSGSKGKLTGRILAGDSYELRKTLMPVLEILNGASLPKVWRL